MAIDTNTIIDTFGTQDTLDNTTSAVTNTSFSDGTNDLSAWTNDDDAPMAVFVLTWQYASGTVDTAGSINLHAILVDIDGTSDTPTPSSSWGGGFIGAFEIIDAGTATDSTLKIEALLPAAEASQVYHFYIENQTDVSISAGWSLKVTPKSQKLHA